MCMKQTAVSHSSAESKKFLWAPGREWKICQHCVIVFGKHFRIPIPREASRAQVASFIRFFFIPSITCHLISLTTLQSTFQRARPFQAGLLHFLGQRSNQSYDHKQVAAPIRDTCRDLTVLIRIGQVNESIWTVPVPFDMCAPQNKWHTFWAKGAFATIQWKSLMRLFDMQPPPKLHVDRRSPKLILFCSLSANLSRDIWCLQCSA